MTSFEINNYYSIGELLTSGYSPFNASIEMARIFVKDGCVYFFSKDPHHSDRIKFILASTL